MGLREFFQRIADNREPDSALGSLVQSVLSPAGAAYGVGARAKRIMARNGLGGSTRLAAPVLSVGNLTLGGTGKTPFTLWLAEWMKAQGRRPVILSRGYGREDEDRLTVVHDGRKLRATPAQAGDEPVLLAQRLGDVPVVACAERARGGQFALRKLGVDSVILDDGFQHFKVERDVDIVLLDGTRDVFDLELFPRGTLREPVDALEDAHLAVITRWNQGGRTAAQLRKRLKAQFPTLPVVRMNVEPASLRRLSDGAESPVDSLRGKRVVLLCGVGNPESFRQTAKDAGVTVLKSVFLEDHAAISRKELVRQTVRARRAGADLLLVTEKDAVKLAASGGGDLPTDAAALCIRFAFATDRDRESAEQVLRARLATKRVKGYLRER